MAAGRTDGTCPPLPEYDMEREETEEVMFQTISMGQLENMLNRQQNFTLLDVRSREEFERKHLEGAVNIPLEELEYRYVTLPGGRTVVVYCAYGSQSLLASRFLDSLGIPVVNTSGGLYYYRGTHLV